MTFNTKKAEIKCRSNLLEYIKFGFVPLPSNIQLSRCLLCKKTHTNKAMKSLRSKDHLSRIHPDNANKQIEFFKL